ncbi:hypothetical protein JCM3770_005596 [Rhodotorula araucariae]
MAPDPASDLNYRDKVLVVAPTHSPVASSSSRAAAVPADLALHPPPIGHALASHHRWTPQGPTYSPHALSDKAMGKRPLEGERATQLKGAEETAKKRKARRVLDSVEIPLRNPSSASKPRPAATRLHKRWNSNESELVSHSPFGSPTASASASASAAAQSPPATSTSSSSKRRAHSFELVIEPRSSSAARRASTASHSSVRPPHLSPQESSASPAPPRRSHAVARARESTFEVVVESRPPRAGTAAKASTNLQRRIFPPGTPAPTRLGETPPGVFSQPKPTAFAPKLRQLLNFADKPAAHPLNQLRLRPPPPPPPAMPARCLNPAFAPAVALGWVAGSYPKKRVAPRLRARSQTPLAAPEPERLTLEPSPAPSLSGSAGQRRSGRAIIQARPASAVYPSAAERLAAAATAASTSSSRASSVSPERSPRPAAMPTQRRKGFLAQLRAKYAFLLEANRAPFRADNRCDGINPDPLSFEWDEREMRLAARADGFPDFDEPAGGPCVLLHGDGRAAELVLRAEQGDEWARAQVRSACSVTEWRYKGFDEARGSASNAETRWATRDWRMRGGARRDDQGDCAGAGVAALAAGDTLLSSPFRERLATVSPERERGREPVIGRKRGATITDVPPSTSSAFGGDDVDMRRGESDDDEGSAALDPGHEDMQDAADSVVGVSAAERRASTGSALCDPAVSPFKRVLSVGLTPRNHRGPSSSNQDPMAITPGQLDVMTNEAVEASDGETDATSPRSTSPTARADKGGGLAVDQSAGSKPASPAPRRRPMSATISSSPDPPKPLSLHSHAALLASSPVRPFGGSSASTSSASSRPNSPITAAMPLTKRKLGRRRALGAAEQYTLSEGLPKGMVPIYKVKVASSEATHVKSYHDAVCVVTYSQPYRTMRLTRDGDGAFHCAWCAFASLNALSTKQHAYAKKSGRFCPGPPAAGRNAQASSSTTRRDEKPQSTQQ